MVDKQVEDFLLVVGNDLSGVVGGFKLFVIDSGKSQEINGNFVANIRAVDVNVRKRPGVALWNLLSGRGVVDGRDELVKVHETVSVTNENLVLPLKIGGKPNILLAFPSDFDHLPDSIKSHPFFGSAFELTYGEMFMAHKARRLLKEQGKSSSEIEDQLTQSQTKFMQVVKDTVSAFQKQELDELRTGGRKKVDDDAELERKQNY